MKQLAGLKVLDLSRILAGPFITMCLADLGADVVKIESPDGGDDTRGWGPPFLGSDASYFLAINRNKKSVTVNLKHPEGIEIVRRLLSDTDVLVENFRQGVMDRLGLSFQEMQRRNPSLVMLHISAFGDEGPYADRPGYDLLAQAMGGFMSVTGEHWQPPVKAGFAIGDLTAGLFGLVGVLAALQERSHTGKGQYVTTSLFESQLALHIHLAMNFFLSGSVPQRLGTAHPNLAPYQAFETSDGYIVVAVGNDHLWRDLCLAVNLPNLANDSRFRTNADRVKNHIALTEQLSGVFRANTKSYWQQVLLRAGVPAGPIMNIKEIYEDPHVRSLGMVQTIEHPLMHNLPQVAFPVHFSGDESDKPWLRLPPPLLGQHTDEVLLSQGYTEGDIARLRASGVI